MLTNKKIIVTRSDENIKEITDITHPIIKEYAKKVDADFYILSNPSPCKTGLDPHHYRIFECKELLQEFDRILCLDSDMLLLPSCPDIFKTVPESCIGVVFEDIGSRLNARREMISKVQSLWGGVGWTSGYINTGCIVISKQHENIFETHNGMYWEESGVDDIHLGYKIHEKNHQIYELPFQFNHMTMFSEAWNNYANRFNSYIIHYAGRGVFSSDANNRLKQIQDDYRYIYKSMSVK